MSHHEESGTTAFHGPKAWLLSLVVGLILGGLLTFVIPATYNGHGQGHDDQHRQLANDAEHPGGQKHHPSDALDEPLAVLAFGDDAQHPIPIPDGPAPDQHAEQADAHAEHGDAPTIPLVLCIPFVLLLGSIALMPFISERFWHKHFPDFAFLLGGIIVAYYLLGFDRPDYTHGLSYGQYKMLHAGLEYYAFIALVGGLYVASGGLLVDVRARGGPVANTLLLAFGAVIANVVGTTGASVLLIRPFLRINQGRLRPIHVVFFIFIVSNCGGALTPIGDPPLYLGYLKGVPFTWTLTNLWPMWLLCVGALLTAFFVIDRRFRPPQLDEDGSDAASEPRRFPIALRGASAMIALALVVGGVFLDPILISIAPRFEGIPVGPTFQIAVATVAYFVASREIHEANAFTFFPVKEVGLLFIGIFATMAPALGYLAAHGSSLGLDSPAAYYFGTGVLSGVLDNAPTYLNFLQVAFAGAGLDLTPDNVHAFLDNPTGIATLKAISLGAVFFGALTYIGNGPNFMVRAIAEAGGVRMPSFFGYMARAIALLLPVLILVWLVFLL